MADCFQGVPIFDHTGQRRDLAWLRGRYGQSPQFTANGWEVTRVWEQSQAMTCGVMVADEGGGALLGYDCVIGWFSVSIEAETRDQGWIDVPINGGQYNASAGATGPMFIRAKDGSWSYTGIGWPYATNHDHLNLDLRRRPGGQPPPGGGGPVDPGDAAAIDAAQERIRQAQALLVEAQSLLERIA